MVCLTGDLTHQITVTFDFNFTSKFTSNKKYILFLQTGKFGLKSRVKKIHFLNVRKKISHLKETGNKYGIYGTSLCKLHKKNLIHFFPQHLFFIFGSFQIIAMCNKDSSILLCSTRPHGAYNSLNDLESRCYLCFFVNSLGLQSCQNI